MAHTVDTILFGANSSTVLQSKDPVGGSTPSQTIVPSQAILPSKRNPRISLVMVFSELHCCPSAISRWLLGGGTIVKVPAPPPALNLELIAPISGYLPTTTQACIWNITL
jgi:hypothetical protein